MVLRDNSLHLLLAIGHGGKQYPHTHLPRILAMSLNDPHGPLLA